ncbi:MAG: hypothetical protein H0V00_05450 [Chloroflexia bacterium]|nr:hypothetical protein [Chloroflexia bacterium]
MVERKRDESEDDSDCADPEGGDPNSGHPPAHEDGVAPTDQAIINEKRALESGEENVV